MIDLIFERRTANGIKGRVGGRRISEYSGSVIVRTQDKMCICISEDVCGDSCVCGSSGWRERQLVRKREGGRSRV